MFGRSRVPRCARWTRRRSRTHPGRTFPRRATTRGRRVYPNGRRFDPTPTRRRRVARRGGSRARRVPRRAASRATGRPSRTTRRRMHGPPRRTPPPKSQPKIRETRRIRRTTIITQPPRPRERRGATKETIDGRGRIRNRVGVADLHVVADLRLRHRRLRLRHRRLRGRSRRRERGLRRARRPRPDRSPRSVVL